MRIFNNGYFALEFGKGDLAKGLKPKGSVARNEKFLETIQGGYVHDGALQSLDLLDRTPISTEAYAFPWPQLLVLTNHVLLCGPKKIYRLEDNAWALKITASLDGGLWTCAAFDNYLYLSNGKVVIVRSCFGVWVETTELPKALALCNFNGQAIAGSVEV